MDRYLRSLAIYINTHQRQTTLGMWVFRTPRRRIPRTRIRTNVRHGRRKQSKR